jgi:hypothetical protein
MPALTGSNQPVALGAGYSLRAPGIVGSAEVRPAGGVGGRARSAEDGTVALADAMAATGVIGRGRGRPRHCAASAAKMWWKSPCRTWVPTLGNSSWPAMRAAFSPGICQSMSSSPCRRRRCAGMAVRSAFSSRPPRRLPHPLSMHRSAALSAFSAVNFLRCSFILCLIR